MLRILTTAASILAVTLALSACEVDTGSETDDDGSTDRTVEFKVDEGALDNARDNLDAAGERVGEAAQSAGDAIQGAAEDVGETIDDNVDVGENARDDDG